MRITVGLLFVVGLPIAAFLIIWFADRLLMERIPKYDPESTKTRTDVYSMRAAYASFVTGLLILAIWAVGVAVLGFIAGLRILY
jgi:hypothetical protein